MKRSLVAFSLGFAVLGVVIASWLHGQPQPQAQREQARELTSYRDVVKRVLPAVVSIETRASNRASPPNPFFFDDPRLPADPNRLGFGSGFIVDPSGVVVTNYHVIEGAEIASVLLPDGRKFTSKNLRSDRRTDVALILLDVKDEKLPVLEFGDSDAMEIGDRVLAVGAPFGLAGSVTHGIISAKGRNGLHLNMYEDFLQTDAAINPGNSGGPLVNLEGKVVGINAAIKSKSGGFQGVGLAVASNLAKTIVPALQKTGSIQRGYLGAHIRELTPDVASRFKLANGGVVLAEIYDKTPAAKAGLKAGDILTAVNGRAVKDGTALQHLIAKMAVDSVVDVDVLRDGKPARHTVVIEALPSDYGINPGAPAPRLPRPVPGVVPIEFLGAEVAELTDEIADDFGYKKGTGGVIITRVLEGGVAAVSQLRRGTVITMVDDTRVNTPAAAEQALKAADIEQGVLLQIATPQGGVSYMLVKKLR
jgi:serine protease Do